MCVRADGWTDGHAGVWECGQTGKLASRWADLLAGGQAGMCVGVRARVHACMHARVRVGRHVSRCACGQEGGNAGGSMGVRVHTRFPSALKTVEHI